MVPRKYSFFVLLFSLSFLVTRLCAQVDKESMARQELQKRNINEEELSNRLLDKGIDVDRLADLSPSEAVRVQKVIEQTIAEMEQEAMEKPPSGVKPPFGEVKDALVSDTERGNGEDQVYENLDTMRPLGPKEGEIYGQHIFKGQRLRVYNQSNDVKPPPSYVLGPGDEVVVSIWGLSKKEEVLEVNTEGYVIPSRMPRIYVKGFTLEQSKNILRDSYRRFYRFREDQFSIALKYSRVIEVNIFGEVENYGGFTLPAINTAFNALVAAGGPTDLGSVRRIKVIRGREVRIMDVYRYMQDPATAADYYLQDNDIIQVPVADIVVEMKGMVNRPFKYELILGEGLKDAITYAGGLKESALRSRIRVLRFVDDQQVLIDINYGELELEDQDFPLKAGDVVIVDSIQVFNRKTVFVSGAVDYPGEYDILQDNRMSNLLRKVGLNEGSRKDISFLKRLNPDSTITFEKISLSEILKGTSDVRLGAGDELLVFSTSEYVDPTYFEVRGEVRKPEVFAYNYLERIRLTDALALSGGLKPEAEDHVFIRRKDSLDATKIQYIRVNARAILRGGSGSEDPEILPGDIITVGSQLYENEERFIDVAGAVRQPGRYEYGSKMSLFEALELAGGLTFNAASNRVDVFRVEIMENQPTKTIVATVEVDGQGKVEGAGGHMQLAPYDQIFVRQVPEFEFQQNVHIEGEVKYPGTYALIGENERIVSLIERAGGLTNEAFVEGSTLYRPQDSIGYVVIDLKRAMTKRNSTDNILLKEGDVLEIPKQQDLVRILGYTNASELYPEKILSPQSGIAVPYYPGKNAKFYIDEFAAGVSKEGNLGSLTVEHANGQIERVANYGLFKVYPKVKKGSVIKVGKKEETEREKRRREGEEEVDWGKVFANSIAQATTILSLILLLQRID